MKKTLKLILTTVMVATLAVGLSACSCSSGGSSGGSSDDGTSKSSSSKVTNFGWYEAEIPEGYEDKATSDSSKGLEFKKPYDENSTAYNYTIRLLKHTPSSSDPNAEAYKNRRVGYDADKYTDIGQVHIGNYDWYVLEFSGDKDLPSAMLYADVADDMIIEVNLGMIDENSDDGKTFLESFKYLGESSSSNSSSNSSK